MKRFLLFAITLLFGVAVMAQLKPVSISKAMQNQAKPAPVAIDNQNAFIQAGNPVVNTKSVMDDVLGVSSDYDMQTNASMMSRLYLYPDGSLAGTWTKSDQPSAYPDRGSGYNYSNGTTWGAAPTARVESTRTGWPNINPWNGNGEILISHNSSITLVMNTRPVKGTGTWTQTLAPSAPTGATGLVWPRVITNGTNHQNVHIIVLTLPTASGGVVWNGLDGALVYYRSLDGGATWDKQGIQLPGLTSANYLAFGGDDYAWVEPHGDTIAFVQGGQWTDVFLMKSYDNGSTWTKVPIFPNYYSKNPTNTVTPTFVCCDGSVAGAMDKNGKFHVAWGRMRATDDGTGHKYYPGTDGIVYWNSTMSPIDTTLVHDIDTLIAHNLCIGYVASNGNPNDSIVGFPAYGVSLTSFPQVTIDAWNNVYFLWSGVTVGNPSPDPFNYRHLWSRQWADGHPKWDEMVDLNTDVLYMFQEYVFPAMAKSLKASTISPYVALQVMSQTSAQPGSNVKDATVPVHEVSFEYRQVSPSKLWTVGVDNKVVSKYSVGPNYPNPAKGLTSFNVLLDKPASVIVEVSNLMGQKVMSMDKGLVNAGGQKFTIDCSSLSSGIYFYTVKINGESFTQKMIVQ